MTNFERLKAMSLDEVAEMLEVARENDICLAPGFVECEKCKFESFCDLSVSDIREWLMSDETSIRTYEDDIRECPLNGDKNSDCIHCVYSGDYHFVNGECVRREDET